MKRGDIVTVSATGDYGKPRPAVVIQSDRLKSGDSVLVSLLTTTFVDAPLYRLNMQPSRVNGLQRSSQIMVDKIIALPRGKCDVVIGHIDEGALITLNHMLTVIMGIAD